MPIGNITQTMSTISPPPHRGVDVQTVFVNKQEDFQDHLADITIDELNTLKDQLNTRIGEINSTTTTMNGYADTASAGASTATTKAGEASTSASEALTSRNQAETFKNNASTSASTATTKASEASASALSASTSASTATTKAGEASASASTATTKASEASASALSASTSASTATTKASEASASALSASTSASTATTKASEASASASQALTSRNQAETFAQQAQASAVSVDVNNIVHRTGGETIAGTKTFSSNIVGNITGNSGTATKLTNSSGDWSGSGAIANVVGMLSWKNYGNGHAIFDASASTAPNGVAVNNTNPQSGWSPFYPTLMGWNGSQTYGVRVDSARVAESATFAVAFTTAVGSAPSYACRAWVNFNGTGTIAIRSSGNVSSITDNGVGDYTVNFTTAMPDVNYSISSVCTGGNNYSFGGLRLSSAPLSSSFRYCDAATSTGVLQDEAYQFISIFR